LLADRLTILLGGAKGPQHLAIWNANLKVRRPQLFLRLSGAVLFCFATCALPLFDGPFMGLLLPQSSIRMRLLY